MFPLHPETPEEGRSLEDLFNVSSSQIRSMISGLAQTAAELGLDFGPRSTTYNSRRAQELGLWAAEKGCGDAYDMAVFRAYFVDCINIARDDVLVDIIKGIGLDGQDAQEVLSLGHYVEKLDKEWAAARDAGVQAIPTFIIDKNSVVGAQSYSVLQNLVEKCGVKRRDGAQPLPLFTT